jgi:hypothetical protein
MTNYCTNLIEVEGDAADLRAFRTTCINESGNLDFEAIIPMPNVLRGTHEGIGDTFGGGMASLAHLYSAARRSAFRYAVALRYWSANR